MNIFSRPPHRAFPVRPTLVAAAVLMLSTLATGPLQAADKADAKALLTQAQRLNDGRAPASLSEGEASAITRAYRAVVYAAQVGGDLTTASTAQAALENLRQARIVRTHPNLAPAALTQAKGSIGMAMALTNLEGALPVMIQEADDLHPGALAFLALALEEEGEEPSDNGRTILDAERRLADEGCPQAKLALGKALLQGHALHRDRAAGLQLVSSLSSGPGSGEAHLALAADAIAQGDVETATHYWELAAQDNQPEAFYDLGIAAQRKGDWALAIRDLDKALAGLPDWPAAKLELARSLAQAHQGPESDRRAFRLMSEAADQLAPSAQPIAWYNLGNFYLNGIGVPRDTAKAREYLGRAAKAGLAPAADLLKTVN